MDADEQPPPFSPPAHLLKASAARTARIKQLAEEREKRTQEKEVKEMPVAVSSPKVKQSSTGKLATKSPASSPRTGRKIVNHFGEITSTKSNNVASPKLKSVTSPKVTRKEVHTYTIASPVTKTTVAPVTAPPVSERQTSQKTLNNIERIQAARDERRAKQAELRKLKDTMDATEQQIYGYKAEIDEFQSEFFQQRKKLGAKLLEKRGASDVGIRVCVRKRPLNEREIASRAFDTVTTATSHYPFSHVYVHEPKTRVDLSKHIDTHRFIFDNVFDETSSNETIYREAASPLVNTFVYGGKATFFAYGQTGSGKTHTVFGKPNDEGVYTFCCRQIFQMLQDPMIASLHLTLAVCFFEVYGGRIYDLLNGKQRVELLEDSRGDVQVVGLESVAVESYEELVSILVSGTAERTTGSTEANPESSRSHAIFQLTLLNPNGSIHGKFSLVDLAGSERGVDTGDINRQSRLEGAEINKSLLALKECIRALHRREPGSHVPFRASKLTQILRDSFVGSKSRTVMVATISPSSRSIEHTLNTLRYADRVKEFKLKTFGGREEDAPISPVLEGDVVGALPGEGDGDYDDYPPTNANMSTNNKASNLNVRTSHNQTLSPLSSDLEYLRLKSPDVGEEAYSLADVVTEVLDGEDRLISVHRSLITQERRLLDLEEGWIDSVSGPGPEMQFEEYLDEIESMAARKIEMMQGLVERVRDVRRVLEKEEDTSRRLLSRAGRPGGNSVRYGLDDDDDEDDDV